MILKPPKLIVCGSLEYLKYKYNINAIVDDVESSETDCMWKPGVPEASTLTSVTSTRVKAPKRRPPSSIFLKENVRI